MHTGEQGRRRSGHRLPVPLTRFVGRAEELAALIELIRDPDVRLISVIGPGGVGKTRLATQAALAVESEYAGRIAIIRLAGVQDPGDVLPTIVRAIGADDGHDSPRESLLRVLGGDDRWLLVLDNVEHLLPAAPDIADLLKYAPQTTALLTTRARLQVAGERNFPLAPLPLPPADLSSPIDLDHYAATRLFVDRASAAGARFSAADADQTIAAICRRLDGLPLAIELAAARAAMLPPAALLAQLTAAPSALSVLRGGPRDEPDRLQSVEAAIAWSYDLLQPVEQAFFRRSSVFVGGFTLAWAAAMIRGHDGGEAYPIDAGVDPRLNWWLHFGRDFSDLTGRRMDAPPLLKLPLDPMDGIQALLDSSLLQTVPDDGEDKLPRYQMLEMIREFGLSRLQPSEEEEAIRVNHGALMLGFAELMREEMWNAPQTTTARRIERELGNIRAILSWAVERGDREAELALRLSHSLWLFWQTRGYVAEGRSWLERALRLSAGPAWDRALALMSAGLFAWIQFDLDRADAALSAARAFWQTTGNKLFLGESYLFSGLVAWVRGDLSRLVASVETALALYRDWESRHGIGICLILLAIVAHRGGQAERALDYLEEAFATCEAANFGWGSASARLYAAEIERDRGNLRVASTLSIEALDRYCAVGDPWGTGAALSGIALLAAGAGEMILAAKLLGASAALRAQAGAFLPVMRPETFAEAERQVRDVLGTKRFARTFAEGKESVPEPALRLARRFAATVMRGNVQAAPGGPLAGCTPRQREVLRRVAEGKTARDIATALFISPRTVPSHVAHGLKALGLTRTEFLARYGGDRAQRLDAGAGATDEVKTGGS